MKSVCVVCGAEFVDGKGWIEKHYSLCANDNYGWNWCKSVPDDWVRPVEEKEGS